VERVCFVSQVRAERLDEYRQRHKQVWPEMLAALRECGWAKYSLFLADDGLLVGYLETRDFEAARTAMALTAVNDRWQAEMKEFFAAAGDSEDGNRRPDEGFRRLPEIFHLD
jgi:L-rhamnose mutarotase